MAEHTRFTSRDAAAPAPQRWLALLRWLLLGLVVWDTGLGLCAILQPAGVGLLPDHAATQRLYLRIIGVFWLFMAYVQYVGWRDPLRNLVAVQVAVTLRLPTALLNLVEALLLYPRPVAATHHHLLLFAAGDAFIWAFGAYALRRLGCKWWVW